MIFVNSSTRNFCIWCAEVIRKKLTTGAAMYMNTIRRVMVVLLAIASLATTFLIVISLIRQPQRSDRPHPALQAGGVADSGGCEDDMIALGHFVDGPDLRKIHLPHYFPIKAAYLNIFLIN